MVKPLRFKRVGDKHYRCLGADFDAHIWAAPKGLGVWAWCIFRRAAPARSKVSIPLPPCTQMRGVAYSLEYAKFDIGKSVAGRRTVYS